MDALIKSVKPADFAPNGGGEGGSAGGSLNGSTAGAGGNGGGSGDAPQSPQGSVRGVDASSPLSVATQHQHSPGASSSSSSLLRSPAAAFQAQRSFRRSQRPGSTSSRGGSARGGGTPGGSGDNGDWGLGPAVELADAVGQTLPEEFAMAQRGVGFGVAVKAPRPPPKDEPGAPSVDLNGDNDDDDDDGTTVADDRGADDGEESGHRKLPLPLEDDSGAGGAAGRVSRGQTPGAKGEREPPRVVEADAMAGGHLPPSLRDQMTSFPQTMRIPSLRGVLKFILRLYWSKMEYDEVCAGARMDPLPLPQFAYFYFCRKFGLESLADLHCTQVGPVYSL